MGSTNHTANYNLSQFVGTDKPAWLQDYNGDMTKIDAGINAAKVAADSADLAAGAAQSDATAANNAITNTITPAITSLQTTIGSQGGTINSITSLIGNGTPTTTDQTIIGAINEINAKVTSHLAEFIVDNLSSATFNYDSTNHQLQIIWKLGQAIWQLNFKSQAINTGDSVMTLYYKASDQHSWVQLWYVTGVAV